MQRIFGGMFVIVFVLALGIILYTIIKSISQTHKNNNSPVLTVNAKVVAKRTQVGHHMHNNNEMMFDSAYTDYFATFEFESGDRLELKIPANQYGYIVDGDNGKLTFQGTRFLKYERG